MTFKSFSLATLFGGVVLITAGATTYAVGARINTTHSIPMGLYWITNRPVAVGEYVLVCPPKSDLFDEAQHRGYFRAGFCPGGYEFLMKKILAAKKSRVVFADEGVYVNGAILPFSKPLQADKYGRSLPQLRGTYDLGENELLLMTDVSNTSFDSRYFGLIDRSHIVDVIRPVFTFNDKEFNHE